VPSRIIGWTGEAAARWTSAIGLGLLLTLGAPPAEAVRSRHAVIVEIDGARYSETFGDPLARWIPHLRHDLAPLGCVNTDFVNLGVTVTVPGTNAVISGTWQPLANDGTERSHLPSVFESWRLATGAPATDTWIVTTKSKLAMLAYSDHPAAGAAYAASTSVVGNDGSSVARAIEVMTQHHPALMLVHLGDTDAAGHDGDWVQYTACLRRADSLAYVLWQAIQADSVMADSTTLFVTNDHGRHDDAHGGFEDHGDGCPGCRHISVLALGAGVRQGLTFDGRRLQLDIVSTIGVLLGFPVPWSQGFVMNEILLEPEGPLGVSPAAGSRLRLASAVPNPSRGDVGFTLETAVPAHVRVAVFDAGGRRIATLFDGPAAAGRQPLRWDGRDAKGHRVPAGRYLVRAVDGRGEATLPVVRVY
jgi:hypothetical protein